MPRAPTSRTTVSRVDPTARPGPNNSGRTNARPRNGSTAWAAQAPGYLLRVILHTPRRTQPYQSRHIRVPSCITFGKLHTVLVLAFGHTRSTAELPEQYAYAFNMFTRHNYVPLNISAQAVTPNPSLIVTLQDDAEHYLAEFGGILPPQEEAKILEGEDLELGQVFEMPVFDQVGMKVEYIWETLGLDHEIELLGLAGEDMGMQLGLPHDQMVFCYGDDEGIWNGDLGGLDPSTEEIAKVNERLGRLRLGRVPERLR